MRRQYHFRPGPAGMDAWDVDRLIRLSADLPAVSVPLADIWELLQGRTTIRAVRFATDPQPDHRNCNADDLPYDEPGPGRFIPSGR